jgi:hypothetical protein
VVVRARVDLLRSLHLRGCQAGIRILPGTALDKRGVELALARVVEKRVACHTAVIADASRQYRVGEQGQLARGDVGVRHAVRLRPGQRRLRVVEIRGAELADLIVDGRATMMPSKSSGKRWASCNASLPPSEHPTKYE